MSDAGFQLYPEISPFAQGWMPTPDGHSIYYEECGNPRGMPVVVLHGGPGSGCTPTQRRFFDPSYYRIILFDQRGCGRSQPAGGLHDNTTWHLVQDIEALRTRLRVNRWVVFGGSWGSTLALAYASLHAQAISAMVLRGIFLSRASELDWFLNGAQHFFPEAWANLVHPLEPQQHADVMGAYCERIFGDDFAPAIDAARNWNAYEAAIMRLLPVADLGAAPDDAMMLARARVQLHYLMHGCFLAERPLLQQIDCFRHIPAILIQGRYDMVCPPRTAYELHQAWPEAEFHMIANAGHAASEPAILNALVGATEFFKQPVQ